MTKAELEEALARSEQTVRTFRGMLTRRNREYAQVVKERDKAREVSRDESRKRGQYQIRMYAALRGLREIAGSTRGVWPGGWAAEKAGEHLKDDVIQEAIDSGRVKGRRPLPRP